MTTCTIPTCRQDYDESNEGAVEFHTVPVYCAQTRPRCNRCNGKPSCYTCGSSFCRCGDH